MNSKRFLAGAEGPGASRAKRPVGFRVRERDE
jgi:hypothetical protein